MPRRRRFLSLIGALIALGLSGPLGAQFDSSNPRVSSVYPDISIEAATHLRTAASYVADQNWSEAIDLYQRLIESFGAKVVQVGSSPVYVTVRDYCHLQIAAMPPAARSLYRVRGDAQAEAWYRAGVRERDRELLARVIDRAFASSWGDDALDALAELAFEAGRFDEAYMLWKRIDTGSKPDGAAPQQEPGGTTTSLIYPDTDLEPALIEAKKLLCLLFQGNNEAAASAMSNYRKRFPNARGMLGGVDGLLTQRLINIARETALPRNPDTTLWSTFAGNAQRSKVVPQAVDIGSVQWTTPLPANVQSRLSIKGPVVGNSPEEMLSYHPLVLRDLVLVSGREEVRAYDLHEGPKNADDPLWTFRLRDMMGQASVSVVRAAQGAPHFTMTADRGRLYVRMGAPETTLPIRRGGQPDSNLVCLDLTADGKEIWRITPAERPEEADLAFEGSPIVADGNLFIGVTRGGAMTHSYLACFDAATGAKKWRTLICESSSVSPFWNYGAISHNLPTLGAGLVFYNTNLGAVAALDQRTGQVRWIATYSRDGRDDVPPNTRAHSDRPEISPCMYHDGLVFALPIDGKGIHAFDALNGELRWKTPDPPKKLTHMLGVAHGNLICTGSQVMALSVATGRMAWQWFDTANMTSYGRGVLAGDYVYFPTKTHIFIIDQRTGVLAKTKEEGALQEKFNHSPGNLVVGEGYLVVAEAKSLTVYCQYDVLINRYRDLIAENPKSADPHFRLARAAEDSGAVELAVDHYRTTIELASPDGPEEERTIRHVAKSRLFSLLLKLSQKEATDQKWLVAEEHYREAATIAPTVQGKLDALLRLAETWRTAEKAEKSLAVYQEVLADESLRGLGIPVEANRTVRADVEIASRVQTLLDEFGRDIYAQFETAAEQILVEAQQSGALPAVERLLRTHPNARAASQALLYLAGQYAENKQYAASSAAYRQLLASAHVPPQVQATAVEGLAQLHESQRSWHAARLWWQKLAHEFPDLPLPSKPEQSVASFVMDHLSRPPYEQVGAADAEHIRLPLARRWNRLWGEDRRVTIPEGNPPAELGLLLLVSNQSAVECVARTGESIWDLKLAGPVRWSAFREEHLLIGTDSQLFCVIAATGESLWQQKTTSGLPGFGEFQVVDDRVYLREDARKLACFSAHTGTTVWSFTPTEGTILPHTFFSNHHVALRTKQPWKFIVLDGDGRRRFEVALSSEPWDHVPVAIDSHRLCMVADARTIQLIDLNDGKQIWSYATLNTDQKPLPIVAPGCLLVLVGANTLTRLEPDTGEAMWSRRVSDGVLPRHSRAWTVDDQMFYCITRELNLRAFRLKDGGLEWEQFLTGPGDQWQIAAAGGYVLALPRQPHVSEGLPVTICRQSDGSLVQRLFFRPRGNEARLHIASPQALIGSEREVWALGKD